MINFTFRLKYTNIKSMKVFFCYLITQYCIASLPVNSICDCEILKYNTVIS